MSGKFSDEQIIKALELCAADTFENCKMCPYTKECEGGNYTLMYKDTLDLINRQKAEIERVRHQNDKQRMTYENIRVDALKEFAERVKQRVKGIYLDEDVLAEVLDEIEKEETTA